MDGFKFNGVECRSIGYGKIVCLVCAFQVLARARALFANSHPVREMLIHLDVMVMFFWIFHLFYMAFSRLQVARCL